MFFQPTDNGVEFRIWSREVRNLCNAIITADILHRQGGYDQTEWASQIGPQILSYYEDYFNTSFPLPKQDMIAIPDFSAGAMENWGLITYREVAILYEEGKSSRSDKEYVAIVVAHELAHQVQTYFPFEKEYLVLILTVVRRPCHHGVVDRLVAQ